LPRAIKLPAAKQTARRFFRTTSSIGAMCADPHPKRAEIRVAYNFCVQEITYVHLIIVTEPSGHLTRSMGIPS
jgi:hypothetical protein